MTIQEAAVFCKNCNSEVIGAFCSNCGQSRKLKRINGKYILTEIGSVFNFEKGILYTIRELFIRPGSSIRTFIQEDRNRLVKPIVFTILCSLFYTFFQQFLQFEDGYVNYGFEEGATSTVMFQWVSQNYGYSNLLMAVFIALWIKILFRKYGYNFFEILILLFFVMGIGMLLFALFGIAQSFLSFPMLDVGFLIGILFMSWAIGQFFDGKKYFNYFKAFVSYMLGLTTFSFFVLVIGLVVDSFR